MRFSWDPSKNARNVEDRGIDFTVTPLVFAGPVLRWSRWPQNYPERRIVAVGIVVGMVVTVVYTELTPADWRIISVRRASRKERRLYAEGIEAAE